MQHEGVDRKELRTFELAPGDVVIVDLGVPLGFEAGFVRPAVVVSAAGWLRPRLRTILVVPCTTRRRGAPSHVEPVPDVANGLAAPTWAQVEHLRSIERARYVSRTGNVGPVALQQLRQLIGWLADLP